MTKERACANTPLMSRRSLLAAAPISLLATTNQTFANSQTSILLHYRDWLTARRKWNELAKLPENGNLDHPESVAAAEAEDTAFSAITEQTPTNNEEISALAHLLFDRIGPESLPGTPCFYKECDLHEVKLILAIWRAASGSSSDAFPSR